MGGKNVDVNKIFDGESRWILMGEGRSASLILGCQPVVDVVVFPAIRPRVARSAQ
jgi:hypothetical protein